MQTEARDDYRRLRVLHIEILRPAPSARDAQVQQPGRVLQKRKKRKQRQTRISGTQHGYEGLRGFRGAHQQVQDNHQFL